MCGIAGAIGAGEADTDSYRDVVNALRHRGPDSSGVEHLPGASLVHTRLQIIDLSATGAQPMSNETLTVWVVFNGEIYNHRELRADLQKRGHHFRGTSDTEVLPHLWEEYGAEMVPRLRGMFALAVYDTESRKLLLARDRFGIKPLFYAVTPERLTFASELNALFAMGGVDERPDPQSASDFAALLYVPAPATFYRGARELLPGELLEATLDRDKVGVRLRRYHAWTTRPNNALDLATAAELADELLSNAVGRQLETDVSLAALLSGGIDSSLVSAAAQRSLDGSLQSFNVRFPDSVYDETWAALAVAQHIKSEHRTLEFGDKRGTWDSIVSVLQQAGQPFADTSIFAMDAVSKLMREFVTVTLSGDGGDEGFGGYRYYRRLPQLAALDRLNGAPWPLASAAATVGARVGLLPARYASRLHALRNLDDQGLLEDAFRWIRGEEHAALTRGINADPVRRLFEPQWDHQLSPAATRSERLVAHATEMNVRLSLNNDYLFKVDTASMRHGLEVRVPLLDEDLFQFGLSLPAKLKANRRTTKRVLRRVAERRLPKAVAQKEKMGFGVPVDAWVDQEFKRRLHETLLGPTSRLPELYDPAAYSPIVEAFCSATRLPGVSREGLYQRAIMLLSAHLGLDARARP